MRFLFRRGSPRMLVVIVACVAALVASGVSSGLSVKVASAHGARSYSACGIYNQYDDAWDANYDSQGDASCYGSAPSGYVFLYPCAGVRVTVNMDAWLTQDPAPGGTRLAESGRTGYETWAADCTWHQQVSVIGWGQTFTTPLWACSWADDKTSGIGFDYVCPQDY